MASLRFPVLGADAVEAWAMVADDSVVAGQPVEELAAAVAGSARSDGPRPRTRRKLSYRREILRPMIDHFGLQVGNVPVSGAFYDAVLAPLGAQRMIDFTAEVGEVIGYGVSKPTFFVSPATIDGPPRESHVAFAAADRATVRAFFDAAVGAGAEVLHVPRVWPEYHPAYYGAFVRDPDGNNVEAVCHVPE
jgi:catechol 2,3-dioxygenase-like lactoylglutathione lyase family enzyme